MRKRFYVWAILRLGLGVVFLWAFIDKLFGLGFATARENAWISGGSPTSGFLIRSTQGPFANFFQSLAGSSFIDWIFMVGLLFIGLALLAGVFVRIGSIAGAIMLFLMWLAVLPPKNNPFVDDHLIYLIILIGFIFVHAGKYWGFGTWWKHKKLVKKYPILE